MTLGNHEVKVMRLSWIFCVRFEACGKNLVELGS